MYSTLLHLHGVARLSSEGCHANILSESIEHLNVLVEA